MLAVVDALYSLKDEAKLNAITECIAEVITSEVGSVDYYESTLELARLTGVRKS